MAILPNRLHFLHILLLLTVRRARVEGSGRQLNYRPGRTRSIPLMLETFNWVSSKLTPDTMTTTGMSHSKTISLVPENSSFR